MTTINDLPANIITNILSRLPLQDAALTSLISRQWQHKWLQLSELVFDDRLCSSIPEEHMASAQVRLFSIIYHVLSLHNAPIRTFVLSVEKFPCVSNEIKWIILLVLSRGVEEFTLGFWQGKPQLLPSSLFSRQQLTRLNLRHCVIEPSYFGGLVTLVSLELNEVSIASDTFARLVSSCSKLEQLKFASSTPYDCLDLIAPSLKVARFVGSYKSICFRGAANLATFSINLADSNEQNQEHPFDWVSLVHGLPALDDLEVGQSYLKSLSLAIAQEKLSSSALSILKALKLRGICLAQEEQLRLVLNLMTRFLNLQNVTVEVASCEESVSSPVENIFQAYRNPDAYFRQLRFLNVYCMCGTRTKMEFIKFVVATAVELERVVVTPDLGKVSREDGGKFVLELINSRRGSRKVIVTYIDPRRKLPTFRRVSLEEELKHFTQDELDEIAEFPRIIREAAERQRKYRLLSKEEKRKMLGFHP